MDFQVEQKISNLIKQQFPDFYDTEGPVFQLFVTAYYEFLESEGQPLYYSRNFQNFLDIDNTLDSFLEYFQEKYLYGIPIKIVANKRLLIKHVKDVYLAKGSIQGAKLLFRLIYNEDVNVYLPGNDILKASDGLWTESKYLEVSYTNSLPTFIGKQIVGLISGTQAVVENYVQETVSENIINILYISNLSPANAQFTIGENIALNDSTIILDNPSVIGSLGSLDIVIGGQGFSKGNIIKIIHINPSNGAIISHGDGALVKVSNISTSCTQLIFNIVDPGNGISTNALTFVYGGPGDTTGTGASFTIQTLSSVQNTSYNTDLACDYLSVLANATAYGFPGNPLANSSTPVNTFLNWNTNYFGSASALGNINNGRNYTQQTSTFVRSTINSQNAIPATSISYANTSKTITGIGTNFTWYFSNNDVILLQANSANAQTVEYQVIKTVANDTSITLYSNTTFTSTTLAIAKVSSSVFPSNFYLGSTNMQTTDGLVAGLNTNVVAFPFAGNSSVATVTAYDSGKAYYDGEYVTGYIYGAINKPTIISGGNNYSNGDSLEFISGGLNAVSATGTVITNGNGVIVDFSISFYGASYDFAPSVLVSSNTGSGAFLSTTFNPINAQISITGYVQKVGVGVKPGRWLNYQGFLNSNKYIEDNDYYQEYSYEIQSPINFNEYKNILYKTFHPSGSKMFGKINMVDVVSAPKRIISEAFVATIINEVFADTTNYTADTITISADSL